MEELIHTRNLRLKPNFDAKEEQELDLKIQNLSYLTYSNIKLCEKKLKQT
jgi:hypothetical protein